MDFLMMMRLSLRDSWKNFVFSEQTSSLRSKFLCADTVSLSLNATFSVRNAFLNFRRSIHSFSLSLFRLYSGKPCVVFSKTLFLLVQLAN
jgi:hypothetical protein